MRSTTCYGIALFVEKELHELRLKTKLIASVVSPRCLYDTDRELSRCPETSTNNTNFESSQMKIPR